MIMYKRINTYKYDSSLLNGTLHTATLFLITESVSNELCTKWRVRGTQCVFMMTAFSASALNHQVIIVQRWALFHFLQWEMLDLVQQHKSTSWLFYWTFGRCWTDGVSECRRNKPRLTTENKPNTSWTWLRVNHTWMVCSHRVAARCTVPLRHRTSCGITRLHQYNLIIRVWKTAYLYSCSTKSRLLLFIVIVLL